MFKEGIENEKVILILLIISAFLIKTMAVLVLNIKPVGDNLSYILMAESLLETGVLNDIDGNIALLSPGWALFLTPFFFFFGSSVELIHIINLCLGVLSVYLLYLCGKEILPSWKWAALATFFWSMYPPAISYTELAAKENLMVPLLLLQILLILKYPRTKNKTLFGFLLGLIFGLEMLVGPGIALTSLIIGIIVSGLKFKKDFWKHIYWKPSFACLFTVLIIVASWMTYTYKTLGTPLLTSNGLVNLYVGNNPLTEVDNWGIIHTPIKDEWVELKKEMGEVAVAKYLGEMARAYMAEHPGKTAWITIRKFFFFWYPPFHDGAEGNQSTLEEYVRIGWLIVYCTLVSLALLSLCNIKKMDRGHIILWTTLLSYCILQSVMIIIFRFRLPIMPLVCILASSGIYQLYEIYKPQHTK